MSEYSGLQFDEVKQAIEKYCCFSGGQAIIAQAQPFENKIELQRELDRLKEALSMTVSYGPMPFSGIHDVSNEVELALKDGLLQPHELVRIAEQAYGIDTIKKYVASCQVADKEKINDLVSALTSYNQTSKEILRCIGYDGQINDNASSALSAIRRNIKSLQATITRKVNEFVARNANYLQDNIIATRNERSVVLVKNTYKNTVEGLQYGSSATGGAVYVEPSSLVPLNNQLQDAYSKEKVEIHRILVRLTGLVKQDGIGILANIQTLAVLDAIFAKAVWAKNNDGIVGKISEGDFHIKQGRHPLIDPGKVVANDYNMVDPVRIILITGPNTGGKTVSLKIIGLFSLMHLSGFPVLASEAQIPFFDHVYYDIGDSQSIDDDLSTFSGHISHIAYICKHCTKKSLVILDELGSATDPNEGQAIASAVLEYLRGQDCYVAATTHFSKLKSYAKQYDDIMISSVEFDQQNLKPTYRYLENTIGQSNAIDIAKRYGLDESIIENALAFKRQQQSESDILLERLQAELEAARQQKQQAEALQLEAAQMKQQIEAQQEKLNEDKEKILADAKSKAAQIVYDAQDEAEIIIDDLKKMKNYNIAEVAKLKKQLDEVVDIEEDEVIDDTISVGDYVRINTTSQKGQVIEMDRKSATVNCGGLKIKSKLENLVKINPPKETKTTSVRSSVTKKSNFSIELNLIGCRVDEALDKLDKYLDDALVARVPYVRIIHGMGTGALRSAIWQQLKRYKFVSKYELGSASEGSSGATIVYFKE